MKNIIKMLENSSVIYSNRANLVQAISRCNDLQNCCDDVLNTIKNGKNAYDIQNAFDYIVVIDETIRTFANSINEDVSKQLNGITEEGFLDKNLLKIKQSSANHEVCISTLKGLISKINNMVDMLKQANKDLDNISESTMNIETCFENLIKSIKIEGFDNDVLVSRNIGSLQSKTPMHTKTIANIAKTKTDISKTIQVYNAISAQIRREIDILRDLDSINGANISSMCKQY